MKKRIISILLAVMMVVSYLPIVNAAGEAKIIGIFVDGIDTGLHPERKISKNGGKLEVLIKTENVENFACMLNIDNNPKLLDMWNKTDIDYTVEKVEGGFKLSLNFPANDTEQDREYLFKFKGKKYTDSSLKVTVNNKNTEEDDTTKPDPNPSDGSGDTPAPEPNPDQGSETDKPEILGFVVDGGKIEKNIIKALGNDGGNYSFVVQTKGITDVNDLIVRVKMGTLSFARGISNTKEALGDGKFKVNFAIEKNGAKSCRVYEIDFGILTNSGLEYIDGIKSTINVDGTENKCVIDGDEEPEEPKQEGLISFINDTDSVSSDSRDFKMAADESEKTFYITLVYGDTVKNDDIKIIVRDRADLSKIVDVNPIITGEKNKRIAKLTFPKNNSNKDIVYDILFKLGSKNTKVSLTHEKTLEVKKADIQIFSLTNENIPLEGSSIKASVFGENFDINKFEIKVFEDDKDVTDTVEVSKFVGREDTATADIKFPKSEAEKVYTIKLYYDGQEKSFEKLKQNEFGSNKEAMTIQANRVVKIGNKIVAEFVHDIFEAYPGALKEQTEIAFDGTIKGDKHESKYLRPEPEYEELNEADKVEVVGNKIIVTLAEDRVLVNAPRIRFGFRTFTDPDGVFNGRNNNQIDSYFINVNSAVITSADIVSGDLYLSEGGDVEVNIFGNGLTNDEASDYTRARIIKNEKLNKDGKQTKLEYTISGQGSEQVLKFKVPENKSDRTESYTILLSTDGRVYSSDVNATSNDRANLLVVSVLPKGKTKDDMTLGFARIQSYGTSGGSDEAPDITHTIPPKGQESKKTWVTFMEVI